MSTNQTFYNYILLTMSWSRGRGYITNAETKALAK